MIILLDINLNDVPKYRKKSKRKRVRKSNHKHIYKKYIGATIKDDEKTYFPVSECEICGKIGDVGGWFSMKNEDGTYTCIFRDIDLIQKLNPTLEIKHYDQHPWL